MKIIGKMKNRKEYKSDSNALPIISTYLVWSHMPAVLALEPEEGGL
jgi:hypothetical protein